MCLCSLCGNLANIISVEHFPKIKRSLPNFPAEQPIHIAHADHTLCTGQHISAGVSKKSNVIFAAHVLIILHVKWTSIQVNLFAIKYCVNENYLFFQHPCIFFFHSFLCCGWVYILKILEQQTFLVQTINTSSLNLNTGTDKSIGSTKQIQIVTLPYTSNPLHGNQIIFLKQKSIGLFFFVAVVVVFFTYA